MSQSEIQMHGDSFVHLDILLTIIAYIFFFILQDVGVKRRTLGWPFVI